MSSKLGIALGASLIATALVIACGGHESADVLGSPGPIETMTSSSSSGGESSSSTSGASTSGTTGSSTSTTSTSASSGVVSCAACPKPPDGCIANAQGGFPDCSCTYRCPDAGGPVKCTWAKVDPCPSGYYCDAQSCGAGTCVAKSTVEGKERQPQCGCDGVTYWNTSVAAKAGMAIRNNNACATDTAAKCGGIAGVACAAGASCNKNVKNKNQCTVVEGQGTCWKTPASCLQLPQVKSRQCGLNGGCLDECSAILKQEQWFEDTCP